MESLGNNKKLNENEKQMQDRHSIPYIFRKVMKNDSNPDVLGPRQRAIFDKYMNAQKENLETRDSSETLISSDNLKPKEEYVPKVLKNLKKT